MTQEEKDLLLKDICGRLPYGLKAYVRYWSKSDWKYYEKVYTVKSAFPSLNEVHVQSKTGSVDVLLGHSDYVIKPYLFPMSSMTEEQEKEWNNLSFDPLDVVLEGKFNGKEERLQLINKSMIDPVQWCYKNHFDVYGLIPMDLALDVTNLNIY